jgi:hypothetical protein
MVIAGTVAPLVIAQEAGRKARLFLFSGINTARPERADPSRRAVYTGGQITRLATTMSKVPTIALSSWRTGYKRLRTARARQAADNNENQALPGRTRAGLSHQWR